MRYRDFENIMSYARMVRYRIAHHEPICFSLGESVRNTTYVRQHYALILQLFKWMMIDEGSLLYVLDHIDIVCDEIDDLAVG